VPEQLALSNVDQAILLTRCAWVRRNRARDEMNRETQVSDFTSPLTLQNHPPLISSSCTALPIKSLACA
jgi:hypothetical protein